MKSSSHLRWHMKQISFVFVMCPLPTNVCLSFLLTSFVGLSFGILYSNVTNSTLRLLFSALSSCFSLIANPAPSLLHLPPNRSGNKDLCSRKLRSCSVVGITKLRTNRVYRKIETHMFIHCSF